MRTFLLVLLLATSGCVSYTRLFPTASLVEVVRPASARERYGEQVLARVTNDSGVTQYTFEDQMVRAAFVVEPTQVHFELTNKTEYSIRIIWDEVTMVLPDGRPSPVMHAGVKYTECRNSKTPSVIPKGVTITDVALPCSNVSFSYSSWTEAPLLSGFETSMIEPVADSTIDRIRRTFTGQELSLLMPLQIEGVTNEYTFRFVVDSIKVFRPLPKR